MSCSVAGMPGWRSHEEIIAWQLSYELKKQGDFARYLRDANAELKETFECLRDGVDRGYFTQEQVVPLQRLSKRECQEFRV
jgi:hypothetical protein